MTIFAQTLFFVKTSMLSLSHAALPKRQRAEHKSLFFALSGGSPFARTPILRKQKELMKSTAWGKFGKNDVCCLTGGDRLTIDREKKAIFVNHVEIMKLGNLVPNFDSTSGHLISLRTGHRIDIIRQAKGQVGWLSIPSGDLRYFGKSSPNELLETFGANFWKLHPSKPISPNLFYYYSIIIDVPGNCFAAFVIADLIWT